MLSLRSKIDSNSLYNSSGLGSILCIFLQCLSQHNFCIFTEGRVLNVMIWLKKNLNTENSNVWRRRFVKAAWRWLRCCCHWSRCAQLYVWSGWLERSWCCVGACLDSGQCCCVIQFCPELVLMNKEPEPWANSWCPNSQALLSLRHEHL